MEMYKAVYKCRMCGERYTTGKPVKTETAIAAMNFLALYIKGVIPETPQPTITHICGGDHASSMGLADFQGMQKEADT